MFRSKKCLPILAMMILFASVIAGCGKNDTQSAPSASTPPASPTASAQASSSASAANEQVAPNDEVRVIAHAMGKTEIKGTPQKVVTLFQGATDAALLLGVQPAGAVEAWIEKPWYNYIRDKMNGVTNLGSENQPDLEAIIKLKPDVIIASKTRHEKINDQLQAIAPTVMTEEVHLWKDTLNLTAEALNKKAEADKFWQEWDQKVADFKAKAGDKLKLEVGIVDFRADHARIVFSGFSALVLEDLGIARPENHKGDSWGVQLTSKENIPQMDADIIFDQTSMDRDDGRIDLKKDWQQHPLWKNLRAVHNNRVYEVDTAVWNNGSGPLAALEMLEDLYAFYDLK